MQDLPTKWYYEYITPDLFLASHLKDVLYSGRTSYQRVEIIETTPFGRCLVLDGRTQSSEADSMVRYSRQSPMSSSTTRRLFSPR